MYKIFFLSTLLTLPVYVAQAQEHISRGNLNIEASWTSLKNLVDAASNRAQAAEILANALAACNAKLMVYAPGEGADSQNCKSVAIPSPTAGETLIRSLLDNPETTNASSFTTATSFIAYSQGTIRLKLAHRGNMGTGEYASSGSQSLVRILKNNTTLASWQASAAHTQSRVLDIDVAPGDYFVIQHRGTGLSDSGTGSTISYVNIYSGVMTPGVF